MKGLTLKLLLLFLLPGFSSVSAQDLTGIWRGFFVTENGEQYRLEFQIKQNRSKTVTGVSYSYLDSRFYGKASMTGNFVIRSKFFTIQELRTVEVRNMGGGGTCLMNYKFTYVRSGKEEFLEGTYIGKTEDRQNPKNNGTWGDCGGGTVQLRRVITSDFYVEPFLRPATPTTKKTTTPPTPAVKPPLVKKTTPKPPPVSKPVQKTPAKTAIAKASTPDSVKRQPATAIAAEVKPARPAISLPVATRSRKNELAQAITVNSKEVVVRLYDNGEIDNDTISVYLNGELVLANKRLSASPITYTIKLDENSPEHTLVMVAENLGRIPPNTSLMVVQDGDKRYQVSITSTEQKNAMVRFRYQQP